MASPLRRWAPGRPGHVAYSLPSLLVGGRAGPGLVTVSLPSSPRPEIITMSRVGPFQFVLKASLAAWPAPGVCVCVCLPPPPPSLPPPRATPHRLALPAARQPRSAAKQSR